MKQTIVEITDDLDGTIGATQTTIGIDGVVVVIDLAEHNRERLAQMLAPYISSGRRIAGRLSVRPPRREPAKLTLADQLAALAPVSVDVDGKQYTRVELPEQIDSRAMRRWWKDNPVGLPAWRANGTFPAAVRHAYTQRLTTPRRRNQ